MCWDAFFFSFFFHLINQWSLNTNVYIRWNYKISNNWISMSTESIIIIIIIIIITFFLTMQKFKLPKLFLFFSTNYLIKLIFLRIRNKILLMHSILKERYYFYCFICWFLKKGKEMKWDWSSYGFCFLLHIFLALSSLMVKFSAPVFY